LETACDKNNNESLYSIELEHTFDYSAPAKPGQLKKRDPVRLQFPSELFPTIKETGKVEEEK